MITLRSKRPLQSLHVDVCKDDDRGNDHDRGDGEDHDHGSGSDCR
jgi:hypothetical protein